MDWLKEETSSTEEYDPFYYNSELNEQDSYIPESHENTDEDYPNLSLIKDNLNNYTVETGWNENTNVGNNTDGDLKESSTQTYVKHWIYFLIVFAMSDFLNCGVLFVILRSRKLRPVSYLIANFSLISIFCTIVGFFKVIGWKNGVLQNNGWFCGISSFITSLLLAVIPLSVMGISYERIRSLKHRIGKLIVSTTLQWIWGVSVVISSPAFFTTSFVHEPPAEPSCKRVNLFGSPAAGIIYEVIRFTVSNLLASGYLAFELYKVRSKLKYLYIFKKIPTKKLRRKVAKVRFAYIYTVIFIIIWFPFGSFVSFVKVMNRNSNVSKRDQSIIGNFLSILFCLYILLSPVIILCTSEDLSDWRKLFKGRKGSRCKNRNQVAQDGNRDEMSENVCPTITEARGTTIANSVSEIHPSPNEGETMIMETDDPEGIRSILSIETSFIYKIAELSSSSKLLDTASLLTCKMSHEEQNKANWSGRMRCIS